MFVKNKKGKIKKSIAINEVSILRQSRQAVSVSIKSGSNFVIKKKFVKNQNLSKKKIKFAVKSKLAKILP